jgi:tRNA wybutosine-synthesizing protein 4
LPGGLDHPFAKTMMMHFDKLQTSLGSVQKYPTTNAQEERFRIGGWSKVRAVNLWELWGSSELDFLTPAQRVFLDTVEPFDEWDEFAIFACHYFLLVAENGTPSSSSLLQSTKVLCAPVTHLEVKTANLGFSEYQQQKGCRRFASSMPLRSLGRQTDLVGNFAGMGLNTRTDSCDAYAPLNISTQLFYHKTPFESPSSRMCHTITGLGDIGVILVGGRASPDKALADCWLYHKWTNVWERIDDLPTPRYRHTTISIGDGTVLVVGGKADSSNIVGEVLIWNRQRGWLSVEVITHNTVLNKKPTARFGGILFTMPIQSSGSYCGLLAGGMSQDGVVLQDQCFWDLTGVQTSVRTYSYLSVRLVVC